MAKFIKKSIDTTVENNILTASIISTRYLEEIYSLYVPAYIKNSFAKTVMSWVWEYYDQYGLAPGRTIQDMYDVECATLDDEDAGIIKTFLAKLSKSFIEDQGVNDEYILEQTLGYFRKREVEIRVEAAQKFLQIGKLDKAEEELFQMKKVMRVVSKWNNPLTMESVHDVFDEANGGILKMPGAMGDFLGPLERGWLIAYLAPFKRGKTNFLMETVVQAALSGLKAVFISCEMKEKNVNERLFKRLSAYGKETSNKVPVFDCVLNQMDECTKACRTNYVPLYAEEDDIPEFDPDSLYKACCACKLSGDKDYVMTTWFEMMNKKEFNHYNVGKKIKSIRKYCGDNIRVKCYPRFTASVKDVEHDLDLLEQVDGFIPDLIVVDFAGILRPDGTSSEVRHGIDEIWKSLASMAAKRSAITFSASQGTRGSLYKENMDQTDLAEWIGILGHVDKMVAINQSADEKKMGVIRLGMLADRHAEFHENEFVYILQALALGQSHLDSWSSKHN